MKAPRVNDLAGTGAGAGAWCCPKDDMSARVASRWPITAFTLVDAAGGGVLISARAYLQQYPGDKIVANNAVDEKGWKGSGGDMTQGCSECAGALLLFGFAERVYHTAKVERKRSRFWTDRRAAREKKGVVKGVVKGGGAICGRKLWHPSSTLPSTSARLLQQIIHR